MNGHQILMKGSVIVVLCFWIGIAVSPDGIGSDVKMEAEDSQIGVTTRMFDQGRSYFHTVFLSTQDYQNLMQYFVELQTQFNTTIESGEIRSLFLQAINELHAYGLLPNKMRVEQAQRLVCGSSLQFRMAPTSFIDISRNGKKNVYAGLNPDLQNSFCFLSATATKIPGYVPSPVILPFGLLLLIGMLPAFFVSVIGQPELANILAQLGFRVWASNPLRVSNYVLILGYDVELRSIGLRGIVNKHLYEGVLLRGYSGLMLSTSDETTFFVGFALNVVSPP